MSKEGINQVAEVFTLMQQLRSRLLSGDTQDIRLGQLLETGKDAMKDEFAKITVMDKKDIKHLRNKQ